MKRFLLAVCFCYLSCSLSAQTKVSIYGDDSYPPYSFLDSGRLTGIYSVILERIFVQMPEYDVTLKSLGWKRGLAQIEKGFIFALYPPYERPKERPYMEYDIPILDEQLVVYCRLDTLKQPRPSWPTDYYGLTIGNNSGFSAGGDKFWAAVEAKKIKVSEAKGTAHNLLNLISGKTDCYMNDGLSIQWELKKLQREGRFDGNSLVQSAIISAEKGFLGFSTDGERFPFKGDFKKKYLSILKQLKDSGEIDLIVKRFIE